MNTKAKFVSYANSLKIDIALLALVTIGLFGAGCSEGFEPFNKVDEFRILSLKAEPPVLTEGRRTVITPLIYTDGDAPITYKWSWCPIAASTRSGGDCVIDEAVLREIAESLVAKRAGDEAAARLDEFPFSFDLGDGPTTQFFYALPSDVLASVCHELISEEIPSFTGIPQCDAKFDIVIQLEVTQKETTLRATKEIPLYIDESRATNQNPGIDGVTVKNSAGKAVSGPLIRGRSYDLVAQFPEDLIDSFTPFPTAKDPAPAPQEEVLFMTWYVTGGETEYLRTTYIEDEVSLKVLRKNSWDIPDKHDQPNDILTLFLVIQDEQGGAGWLVRDFEIEEE